MIARRLMNMIDDQVGMLMNIMVPAGDVVVGGVISRFDTDDCDCSSKRQ